MKNITFLFLFFIAAGCFAQKSKLAGTIIADSIATTQVNIVNLTQKVGTVNNVEGKFVIDARAGDELIFSSVQYEPYQITVIQENLEQQNKIYLFTAVNELEEVNISNIDLTGDLLKDAASIKTKPHFLPSSVGLQNPLPVLSTEDRRLYTAQSGGPVGVLIDVLSGRMAMLKRMKEIAKFEGVISKAQKLVPNIFIVEELKIPTEFIDDFFYFCAKDEAFENLAKKADELQLMEFLTSKKEAYFQFKEWKI
jgi:hypothetical protein